MCFFSNDALHEISQNIRSMMEELWLNWSHLGVEDSTKITNITKLVQIEKELHRDVILETRQKLIKIQKEVDKLKEETEELSRCLSVDITILDFKEDMMLVEYKRELEEQIAGEQMEQRRMKMERLLEWQRDLADKLGITIQELQEVPLPSEEELDRLKEHLEVLQAERDKRAETFLHTQVEIKDIMDKLQIKPQNKFEHIVVTSLSVDFKVTDLNMDRLAKLQQDLQEKYEQTNNRVLELRERLTKLWECLEEDRVYCENFLHAHPGCHPQTEAAIKEEIKRCEQIKRQKIQVFVANVRTKIKLMWDNVMYSTHERDEFAHYYQDIFTEDTLTLHELYLEKITKFYNEHKAIVVVSDLCFGHTKTRVPQFKIQQVTIQTSGTQSSTAADVNTNLWSKMNELEARASEPGRYNNRGGQLLKEERERKVIASNLPKIEAQLKELVVEYEAKTGGTFTVDGKPVLQVIEEDWENRKMERQNKLSARKQALTPQTPSLRSLATSPLGKRNRTAAGLAATAERNKPPSKRQLMTGSATKAVTTFSNNLSALKRSAISTVKRRISGRLAARVVAEGKPENAKRKLDYGLRTPKATVNGSILKHKRTSLGKRKSNSRRSTNATRSTASNDNEEAPPKDPLMESTLLTTYTDFKSLSKRKSNSRHSTNATRSTTSEEAPPKAPLMESTLLTTYTDFKVNEHKYFFNIDFTPSFHHSLLSKRKSNGRRSIDATRSTASNDNEEEGISEKQMCRSSMATSKPPETVLPAIVFSSIEERKTPTTPRTKPKYPTPLTPKVGKENIINQQVNVPGTPKSNLLYTPTRLTRSALKLDNNGFATPRAPLSANKVNLQRQNTISNMQVKTTPNSVSRSKSHTHLVRVKNLPPLI
ncbi:unnamed protein product [Chilo suppressalis]|uniref:Protein regulator of cytokinesis 1 n=1 Tax=Chilo suppressalis TaxID=168631 RepID=A0ABN8AV83_CHISP|nr:unnamed protein product [Chilo suppressalis]